MEWDDPSEITDKKEYKKMIDSLDETTYHQAIEDGVIDSATKQMYDNF